MKKLQIVQLVLSIVIVFALIAILVAYLAGGLSWSTFFKAEKQVVLIEESANPDDISQITSNLGSADVYIYPSETDSIQVRYLGPESEKTEPKVHVTTNGEELSITQDITITMFQIVTTERRLEIYLPETYQETLDIKNASGDIKIDGDYTFDAFKLNLMSGDVTAENLVTKNAEIRVFSGNVSIDKLDTETYIVDSKSGDIVYKELKGDGSINSTSGDIRIDQLESDVEVHVTSGQVTIAKFTGQGEVGCISGDIQMDILEPTGDLNISSTSGDVRISLDENAGYQFDGSCTAGDISSEFPLVFKNDNNAKGDIGKTNEYSLSVNTTAGDISIK